MPNLDGWAYAADIDFRGRPASTVDPVMREHGLVRSVPSETWHFVPTLDGPLTGVVGFGSSGPVVTIIQSTVGVGADGLFGAKTRAAVARWQDANRLAATGDWGPAETARAKAEPADVARPGVAQVPRTVSTARERVALARIRDIAAEALGQ